MADYSLPPAPKVDSTASSITSTKHKEAGGTDSSTSIPAYSSADGGGAFSHETSLNRFYKPIAEYEGAHRYDPAAEWTEVEEKRIVKKVRIPIQILCGVLLTAREDRL